MSTNILLSRNEFREAVFNRDKNKCVFCSNAAKDAHHIIERRLWPDGGYYLNNGASVCEQHHLECEATIISVEQVREKCGVEKAILPPHLYSDEIYDKWGNIILPNGTRLKGELFFDDSVQKILKDKLHLFTNYVKYPRTHHLPWSENITDDDRVIDTPDIFKNKRVIVTEKMDGENTTLYNDYIHARSLDGRNHYTRNWVKNLWSQFCGDIPSGWRVCGENLYAVHSIKYENLNSYFLGFSIWNEKNECLSWDNTLDWFKLLGIFPVKVLYDDIYNEKLIKELPIDFSQSEGYVIRMADSFSYGSFRKCVAKYVRKNHVMTVKHWMHGQKLDINTLALASEQERIPR